MAIFHFSAKILKRSEGKNSLRAAAYRSAEKFTDPATGCVFDYTKKKGVDDSFILAPKNSPKWVYDREQLWGQVEKVERRKDAQLARDFDVALPRELTRLQQVAVLSKFVHEQFVSQGMIADLNCHDLDSHNPHAHVMLTLREIGPDGFGKKNRRWNDQNNVERWRAAWADACNSALAAVGFHTVKIDHRSYERQGLELEPSIHLGPAASKQEKAGVPTPQGDHNRAVKSVNDLRLEIRIDEHRAAKSAIEKISASVSAEIAAQLDFENAQRAHKSHAAAYASAVSIFKNPSRHISSDERRSIDSAKAVKNLTEVRQKKVEQYLSMPWYRKLWAVLRDDVPSAPNPSLKEATERHAYLFGQAIGRVKEQARIAGQLAQREMALIEAKYPQLATKTPTTRVPGGPQAVTVNTKPVPTQRPTEAPTQKPSKAPTTAPTPAPTPAPTSAPTEAPKPPENPSDLVIRRRPKPENGGGGGGPRMGM